MRKFTIVFLCFCISICSYAAPATRDPFQAQANTPIENMQTAVIPLHYKDAVSVSKLLTSKNSHFLSAAGSIAADKQANSLWIRDTDSNINAIKKLIRTIDKQDPQIQITARIVNIDSNFTRELGLEFGTVKNADNVNTGGLNMDVPGGTLQSGIFNFTLATLRNNNTLDMQLSALESEGHAKIVSTPELITLDRKPAHISSGEDIPYQEKTGEGNTSTTFKKAVLGLKVTPIITANNKILLDISVNQDKVSSILVQGVPVIQTREIQTKVLVNNKQTLVLGGIHEQGENHIVSRIPFLGSIPLLGALFRKTTVQKDNRELLIFITPKIIR